MRLDNESQKHARHIETACDSQAAKGESHFNVFIKSDLFEGVTKVNRHRMVNKVVSEELDNGKIHAFQLKTETPYEFDEGYKKVLMGDKYKPTVGEEKRHETGN